MIAADLDYEDICAAILSHSATDPNLQDSKGRTALMRAIIAEHCDLCESLLENSRKWRLNVQDNERRTALWWACSIGQPLLPFLQALVAMPGIDANLCDSQGRTALMEAAGKDEREVVALLLATSGLAVDVNLADSTGTTALTAASRSGRTAIVELLMSARGIDVNLPDANGWTALMHAAAEGQSDVVRLLCKSAALDLNAADADGNTALILAAKTLFADCVQALLQEGMIQRVSLAATDRQGLSAVDWARRMNRDTSFALLTTAVAKYGTSNKP